MSGVESVMSGKHAKQLVCPSPALPASVIRLPHLRMLCATISVARALVISVIYVASHHTNRVRISVLSH
jgi:hypothetical protein